MSAPSGRLYGLGLGPGDPELLTLKALRLLREVAVIAYPAPEHGDSFARSIVAAWIEGHQREIAIRFPMRPGPPPVGIYETAAAALAVELGRHVAKVRRVLDRLGLLDSAVYVEHATLPTQCTVPLAAIESDEAPY